MFCILKNKNISCLSLKTQLKSSKTSYSTNDSKWRKKALSCFEKILKLKNCKKMLREITSKHHCNFYCLSYLHSFATENERESCQKNM